jgi:hypothetical protein
MSTKALAALVTVGVVMGFLMVEDGVSWAAAVSSNDAAARADANLMRTMVMVMWRRNVDGKVNGEAPVL